jgi:hypothetical protein
MYRKTYYGLNNDECKIENDADDEGPVDILDIDGVMVMAKAMTMPVIVTMPMIMARTLGMIIVIMCMCHDG